MFEVVEQPNEVHPVVFYVRRRPLQVVDLCCRIQVYREVSAVLPVLKEVTESGNLRHGACGVAV